jgi:hypothetical protein
MAPWLQEGNTATARSGHTIASRPPSLHPKSVLKALLGYGEGDISHMASEMAVWVDSAAAEEGGTQAVLPARRSGAPVPLHARRARSSGRCSNCSAPNLSSISSVCARPGPTRTGRTLATRSKDSRRRSAPGAPPKQPAAPRRCPGVSLSAERDQRLCEIESSLREAENYIDGLLKDR